MIDRYVNTKLLERERESILIDMEFERPTTPHNITLKTSYEKAKYKSIMKDRWDPFDNEPIENVSKLCYLLRKVSNTDMTRIDTVRNLIRENKRCIIFYNFDYELDILRQVAAEFHIGAREWNGHRHDKVPDTDRWVYLCQYTSAAEGWNCITTNVMIFYSLNYSYKTMIQAAGRIDRLNTSYKDLYYYYLRSNSPIDLAIMSSLKRKKKFNERNFIERNN
jgi:superfamily II DNA or RNA helicase